MVFHASSQPADPQPEPASLPAATSGQKPCKNHTGRQGLGLTGRAAQLKTTQHTQTKRKNTTQSDNQSQVHTSIYRELLERKVRKETGMCPCATNQLQLFKQRPNGPGPPVSDGIGFFRCSRIINLACTPITNSDEVGTFSQ